MSSDQQSKPNGLRYRDAGVDIDRGNQLVERIKPLARSTLRPEVMGSIGGFGALMQIPMDRYREPVLVSGTDGVGTKLRLAIDTGRHKGVGIDLVAMCANDILTLGAEPFFFLDYLATARIDEDVAVAVIEGIAAGCREAGAALVGGETAEMPGMYANADYDLAGFCVGLVERDEIIDGTGVRKGDKLVGLASSGPHSNGYSLIRKILEISAPNLDDCPTDERSLLDALMEPTRIYAKETKALLQSTEIKALSHITGGGLLENIPRVLPAGLGALLDLSAWRRPWIFDWLQSQGGVVDQEMLRTFNCGIGMVACMRAANVEVAISTLRELGQDAWVIGEVVSDQAGLVTFER